MFPARRCVLGMLKADKKRRSRIPIARRAAIIAAGAGLAMVRAKVLLPLVLIIVSTALPVAQERRPDVCPRDAAGFAAIQKRAEAGDAVAQTALASCYDLGRHVQPNGKQSIRWLTEAANQGYAPAEYELGRIYLYGRGVPADYSRALLWESKAAGQGDARAQRDLAFMYERGFGVPADPAKALEWNRQAAAQGQADAQLELARKFAKRPDCMNAVRWYKEAAAHGHPAATYELGKLYLTHKCGSDRNKALMWFTIGARFGSEDSKAEIAKLARTMSAAEKRRAEIAADKWVTTHAGAQQEGEGNEKEER